MDAFVRACVYVHEDARSFAHHHNHNDDVTITINTMHGRVYAHARTYMCKHTRDFIYSIWVKPNTQSQTYKRIRFFYTYRRHKTISKI